MIEEVRKEVIKILGEDNSGHNIKHIDRVLSLSLEFAEKMDVVVDKELVVLIALLHDVDDYKLVGKENSTKLTNANMIMDKVGVDDVRKKEIIQTLNSFGYSKSLKGIRPTILEGMIVSDADMCDGLGANGILRVYAYSTKHNRPFFDYDTFPNLHMSQEEYMSKPASSSVCHIFEKILKLKDMMLTVPGKEEALKRHNTVVQFLYSLFAEERAPEWSSYLTKYLNGEIDYESNNNQTAMGKSNSQKVKRI